MNGNRYWQNRRRDAHYRGGGRNDRNEAQQQEISRCLRKIYDGIKNGTLDLASTPEECQHTFRGGRDGPKVSKQKAYYLVSTLLDIKQMIESSLQNNVDGLDGLKKKILKEAIKMLYISNKEKGITKSLYKFVSQKLSNLSEKEEIKDMREEIEDLHIFAQYILANVKSSER